MSRESFRKGKSASMPIQVLASLLIGCLCAQQSGFAAEMQPQTPPPSGAASHTITAPAGTLVPLTLVSPIKSKSTKVGDPVRAVVAFPITEGAQVAIPAGTYVEGVITSLTAQGKKTRQPDVQIHFTRLLYANGYVAELDAANSQARVEIPGAASPMVLTDSTGMDSFGPGRTRVAFSGGEGFAYAAQTSQQPTLPTPPSVGPSIAEVMGISWGIIASLIVTALIFGRHHRANVDYVLFGAGWQFQMTLASPLTVDAGQVAAAAATSTH
jgi:hypothetical protein